MPRLLCPTPSSKLSHASPSQTRVHISPSFDRYMLCSHWPRAVAALSASHIQPPAQPPNPHPAILRVLLITVVSEVPA
jgi:hypothetical protein